MVDNTVKAADKRDPVWVRDAVVGFLEKRLRLPTVYMEARLSRVRAASPSL
jgi:hypothetical protein